MAPTKGHGRRTSESGYQRVANAIRAIISDGNLAAGDSIPSEPELAQLLSVGRPTVREALVALETEGLVTRSQGSRTIVTNRGARPSMGLEVLEPLESFAARQGWDCGTANVVITQRPSTRDEAQRLSLRVGDPVSTVLRTKTIHGRPVAYMTSVVPSDVVPADVLLRDFSVSITEFFADFGPLEHAEGEVTATAADAVVAKVLQVAAGAPVLVVEELFFGSTDRPLAWNVNYFAPGLLRLTLSRRATRI